MKKDKSLAKRSELDKKIVECLLHSVTYILDGITCNYCKYYIDEISSLVNPSNIVIFVYDSDEGKAMSALINKGFAVTKNTDKFSLFSTGSLTCEHSVLAYRGFITIVILKDDDKYRVMKEKHDGIVKAPLEYIVRFILSQKTAAFITDIDHVYNWLLDISVR